VQTHLIDQHLSIGGGVEVAAELKIAATASRPLSALQGMGGNKWQIIGHSKQLMEPVATPSDTPPKRLYTTGCVTVRNYSNTKAGALAEFHHTVGALVVEVDTRSRAFVRQLGIYGDSLFDVAGGKLREYGPDWVKDHDRVLAITTGDEHVKFHDRGVYAGTYGPEGMCTTHSSRSTCSGTTCWTGTREAITTRKTRCSSSRNSTTATMTTGPSWRAWWTFINGSTPEGTKNYIVDSNHHDHLRQWLSRADVNKDHRNALLIAELQAQMRHDVLAGVERSPLQIYCEGRLEVDTDWLDRNKPFLLKGVDYSQHGDIGVNGARGSASALAKTAHKSVIGHSHTARIVDGCYQVGYSAGDLEYAKGMGTWTHTHCIQYPNGKRTLVDIWRGRWHG
jgi:hypothetical protein